MSETVKFIADEEELEVELHHGEEAESIPLGFEEDPSPTSSEVECVFTVEEVMEKLGFGFFQILVTVMSGLVWTADAMELMILSVLSPALQCEWCTSKAEEATVTTVVFMGFLFGGLFWGPACDSFGRKPILVTCNCVIFIFGLLSAIPVSSSKEVGLAWLIAARFGVGFGAGGSPQAVTYFSEFLPNKSRGVCISFLEVFWAVGSIFGAMLALVVMPTLGWHAYLAMAALPLLGVIFIFPFVPESARYHIARGNKKKAMAVLRTVARLNRRPMPVGELVTTEEKERRALLAASTRSSSSSGQQTTNTNTTITTYASNGNTNINTTNNIDTSDYTTCGSGAVLVSSQGMERDAEPKIADEDQDQLLEGEPSAASNEQVHLLDSEGEGGGGGGGDDSPSQASAGLKLPLKEKLWNKVKFILSENLQQLKMGKVLFNKQFRLTSLLLIWIWFGCAWLYYGIVLLTTTIIQYEPHCGIKENTSNTSSNSSVECECDPLDTNDYLRIVLAAAAELPGILVTLLIIECVGRKLTMGSEFLACTVSFALLYICAPKLAVTAFLFIIRAFATGVFQAVYVYTPEVFPTRVRAMAMAFFVMAARVGGIVTPYVAQVLLHANDYATITLYTVSSLLLAVAAMFLPIETKGKSLKDTADDMVAKDEKT